jgi:hypothetical protein
MNINKNNYEAYFIDYYEGKLTAAQKQALELFLSENPELKEEFEQYEEVPVEAPDITFSGKPELKQQEIIAVAGITEENYEELFIAFYENDLDEEKQKALQLFLEANPQLEKEFGLHKSLILSPDPVTYAGKSGLKKKSAIGYYWYATAAAAVIMLLLAFQFLFRQHTSVTRQEQTDIAQLTPQNISISIAPPVSGQLIAITGNTEAIQLPGPDPVERINIPLMASTDIKNIATTPDYDAVFESLTYNYHLVAPAETTGMTEPKSLLAKVFRKNLSRVKDEIGIDMNRTKKDPDEPAFVRFVDGSLMVFNTLTGSDAELVKNYDKNGRLRNYRLEGETLLVSRKVPSGGAE